MKKDQMIFEPFVYHWHHCLVQTSVIHISKIHGYGLLDSFDFISFEGCESPPFKIDWYTGHQHW